MKARVISLVLLFLSIALLASQAFAQATVSFTAPRPAVFGALLQSTVTQRRFSFSIAPLASLSSIHGSLAAAVKSKGAFPLLNTST